MNSRLHQAREINPRSARKQCIPNMTLCRQAGGAGLKIEAQKCMGPLDGSSPNTAADTIPSTSEQRIKDGALKSAASVAFPSVG
jgi:hypothetical protein